VPEYRVAFKASAEKEFFRLPDSLANRIFPRIKAFGADPRPQGCKKLSGGRDQWRIYVGDYRVIYTDEVSSESYDQNGNTMHESNGNSYTYDSESHMISMTNGSKVVTMVYDAFGNRVAKTVNGVTTKYLVEDDVNPTGLPQVLEEVQNGIVVRTYTYGLQRISQSQFVGNVWTTSFYVYDGAGSVRELTDTTGKVTDGYEYDAYGNSFTKQGTTPNNYLYRGEQYDNDLGLYYLRARYYNPNSGRFMSRDPEAGMVKDPRTLHKYLYAGGDPVNASDPTGREILTEYSDLNRMSAATQWVLRKAACSIVTLLVKAALDLEWGITGWPGWAGGFVPGWVCSALLGGGPGLGSGQ